MLDSRFSDIHQDVKLVIWDLDETFWDGTLSEGGIRAVSAHLQMVRSLVDRGIMCSICSKNDFDTAKQKLVELGVWDLFVFPHIDWSPKGAAVKSMLDRMGLRAANALFLDDNHLNLQEVQFFCPEIACVNASGSTDGSGQDLAGLLDLPALQGKDDRAHSRLAQYKVAELKEADQKTGNLSNHDFLRQSDIQVKLITDLDGQMDRVIELINRTNQLNFTKLRVQTDQQRAEFQDLLRIPGVHAGLVEVRDRYGDYGIVGFFCLRKRFNGVTMHHFCFSCRTLNMGVEQWVWDHLGRPEFDIAGPVANGLEGDFDWIRQVSDFGQPESVAQSRSLALVGGCDLQQVSFYCGTDRREFVNKPDDDGVIVRYDDTGFILNPRDPSLDRNWVQKAVAGHSYSELLAADQAFASADLVILSMFFAFRTDNLFTHEGHGQQDRYLVTIPPKRLSALTQNPRISIRLLRTLRHLRLDMQQRLDLVQAAFERVYGLKRPDATLFILGVSVHGDIAARTQEERQAYNQMCRSFASERPGVEFIDIDATVPQAEFVDSDHYTRTGYFRIAERINAGNAAADTPELKIA
ncbi:hypothetical protein [Paracoccus shanxieyensis]|uniref:HAD-IIIC family phosphatase n=1 Tax=Paracoccus shanxieyensis TaxID=2675752 RepID=A0A6L6IS90_9RHOB|nr:hypothetical protein [Paracoccus shanxieyensis]MTH63336.1 hypothetical protein [Paracoccus shanxieyensis]MTH87250.1 hypothetical protein [Paracoccus shanxieyensis]